MSMTKGEYRVGIDFNPSNDDLVGQIKRKAADLIDLVAMIPPPRTDEIPDDAPRAETVDMIFDSAGERKRLMALAQTAIEEGAMWAVKAATKPLAR